MKNIILFALFSLLLTFLVVSNPTESAPTVNPSINSVTYPAFNVPSTSQYAYYNVRDIPSLTQKMKLGSCWHNVTHSTALPPSNYPVPLYSASAQIDISALNGTPFSTIPLCVGNGSTTWDCRDIAYDASSATGTAAVNVQIVTLDESCIAPFYEQYLPVMAN